MWLAFHFPCTLFAFYEIGLFWCHVLLLSNFFPRFEMGTLEENQGKAKKKIRRNEREKHKRKRGSFFSFLGSMLKNNSNLKNERISSFHPPLSSPFKKALITIITFLKIILENVSLLALSVSFIYMSISIFCIFLT